jgi:hypothetical protein
MILRKATFKAHYENLKRKERAMKRILNIRVCLMYIMSVLFIFTLTILFLNGTGVADIPEPDVIYYGAVELRPSQGADETDDIISLRLNDTHEELDSYVLGTISDYDPDVYVVRVTIDALESIEGKAATFYVGDESVQEVNIADKGSVINLDLSVVGPDTDGDGLPDSWEMSYFGTLDRDGSGNINGDGETDGQEYNLGTDPTSAFWQVVDVEHRETCVSHPLVLQKALTAASSDGRHNLIKIQAGAYKGNFFYRAETGEDFDLEIIGRYAGCDPSEVPDPMLSTILDGDIDEDGIGDGAVLVLDTYTFGTSGRVLVEGLDIKNGSSTGEYGGGLTVLSYQGEVEIISNRVENCAADDGGGIKVYTYTGPIKVMNNLILDNTSTDFGGGLYLYIEGESVPVFIANNTINGNLALKAGGIYCYSLLTSPVIQNNIITNSTGGEGICAEWGVKPVVDYNNIWNNADGEYCDILLQGENDISEDPLFVDTVSGDYTLNSDSPCIDAGLNESWLPETDKAGNPRAMDGDGDGIHRVDMGAYELVAGVIPEGCDTLIDSDCDGMDDAWEIEYFLNIDRDGTGDINDNGKTDLEEFQLDNDPTMPEWEKRDKDHLETLVSHPLVLQKALMVASLDGWHNIIKVRTGTYPGNFSYIAEVAEDYNLEILGGYGAGGAPPTNTPNDPDFEELDLTILDGDADGDGTGDGPVLYIDTLTNKTSGKIRVEGFYIRNGAPVSNPGEGGGICVRSYRAEVEITGNRVSDCIADYGGGMRILTNTGQVTVIGNTLTGNIGNEYGGGISLRVEGEDPPVYIANNTLVKNRAPTGGGICCNCPNSSPVMLLYLVNNTLNANYALKGGGIDCHAPLASLIIQNNIITNTGGGGGIALSKRTIPEMRHNNMWNNTDGDLNGNSIQGTLNISQNPLYIDALGGDFALQQESPCIDKGKNLLGLPNTDQLGDHRIMDGDGDSFLIVDMGAYEFTGPNEVPIDCDPLIDMDCDGVSDDDDKCPGYDDRIDADVDGIPDDCDDLVDSDGDGVADLIDQCPGYDDTIDNDGDGIIDGCDQLVDSDNDGVEDTDDQCPEFDDELDDDGDGIPNACDDTWSPENHPPSQPLIIGAINPTKAKELDTLTPTFETQAFSDPDLSDPALNEFHSSTRWQISEKNNFSEIIFDAKGDFALTAITIPHFVLIQDFKYYLRVRFYDSIGAASEWSETYHFQIFPSNVEDADGDGIPDAYEVDDATVDLDSDGTPDIYQSDMKIMYAIDGITMIGVKTQGDCSIDNLTPVDPADIPYDVDNRPDQIPFGLIGYKLSCPIIGQEVTVTVYISADTAEYPVWYRVDYKDGWHDYSGYAEFLDIDSIDNKTIIQLTLKDGAFGDSDRVRNSIIIDPSGIVYGAALLKGEFSANGGSEGSSDGSGGSSGGSDQSAGMVGCFIDTLSHCMLTH